MTELDIAIEQAEDMAKLNEAECFEYAEEYRQLVSWLKELKALREQERPHGEWRHYEGYLTCSECSTEYDDDIMTHCGDDVPKFCPNCGADMRPKEGETE